MPLISICANTDAKRRQYIHQYNPNTIKYKPIQALIQTNTSTNTDNAHIIVFYTCTSSTCQYRHWYCRIRRPRPQHPCSQHHQHPSLLVSQGLLCLLSSTLELPPNQPHPLVRCQTVPGFFVVAKLSTPLRTRLPIW